MLSSAHRSFLFTFAITAFFIFTPSVFADAFDGENVTIVSNTSLTNLSGSIDPVGVWTNGTSSTPDTIYIVDDFGDRIWTVNSSIVNTSSPTSLPTTVGSPREISGNSTGFWVMDASNSLIFTLNSSFDVLSNVSVDGSADDALASNGTAIFTAQDGSGEINVTDLSGNQVGIITCVTFSDCENVRAITVYDSDMYVIEGSIIDTPRLVRVSAAGTTLAYRSLENLYSSSDLSDSITTTNGQDFWIIDRSADLIYHTKFSGLNSEVTITYPESTDYDATVTELNYSLSNGTPQACWYSLNQGATNISITCGENVSGLDSGEGSHIWTVYANNSNNYVSSDVVSFSVAFEPPLVNLISPLNNTFFSTRQNINLTYNITDPNGLSTVEVWHDFTETFAKNLSRTDVSSGVAAVNFFNFSSDGRYFWNVWANDTTDRGAFNHTNFTFVVDTTGPNVTITAPNSSQTQTSATVGVDYSLVDAFSSISSCKWTKNGGVTNSTLTCGTNISDTFSEGANTVRVYSTDSLGNEAFAEVNFTVDLPDPPPAAGGGASASTTTIIRIPATNFSITTFTGGNVMDFVLARGSVRPRTKSFVLRNRDIEPILVTLVCDTTTLNASQRTDETPENICDYVTFSNTTISISPNEDLNTQAEIKVLTPPNASFGDTYAFNILALHQQDAETTLFAKLSATSRVPIWGIIYKWSFFPFQDPEKEEAAKRAYPLAPMAVLAAFSIFTVSLLALRRRMPLSGFLVGVILFFVTLPVMLIFL